MQRLTLTKDYDLLRNSRKRVVGRFFIVVYLYAELLGGSLAGFTVSKKVGNAVVRNKVKRRIRAFLRGFTPAPETTTYKCNIIALPAVTQADWLAFTKDLTLCLSKIPTVDTPLAVPAH